MLQKRNEVVKNKARPISFSSVSNLMAPGVGMALKFGTGCRKPLAEKDFSSSLEQGFQEGSCWSWRVEAVT